MFNYFKKTHSLFEELVFENRNKAYGAYSLRKLYVKHINKGLLIANLILVSFFLILFFYYKAGFTSAVKAIDYRTVEFSPDEQVKISKLNQKLPPPPKIKSNSAVDAPLVVKEDVKPEEKEDKKDKTKDATEKGIEEGIGKKDVEKVVEPVKSVSSDTSGKEQYSNEIFMKVEIPAQFPGGEIPFHKFLFENIKFPDYARMNRIDGIIYVHFVVNTDGSLSEMKIMKGIEQSINDEMLRVWKLMPKWIPARQKGVYVRQRIIVPVRYKAP